MITNNVPLQSIIGPSCGLNKSVPSPAFRHYHLLISNFIANILSKAFLSLFADFYSPLKNPSIR